MNSVLLLLKKRKKSILLFLSVLFLIYCLISKYPTWPLCVHENDLESSFRHVSTKPNVYVLLGPSQQFGNNNYYILLDLVYPCVSFTSFFNLFACKNKHKTLHKYQDKEGIQKHPFSVSAGVAFCAAENGEKFPFGRNLPVGGSETSKKSPEHKTEPPTYKNVVCHPTLFKVADINVIRLWARYYLARGFDQIFFYTTSVDVIQDIEGVTWFVAPWQESVFRWPTEQLYYQNQMYVIHHCLFWNRERGVKYALFADADEYLYPLTNVNDLVEKLSDGVDYQVYSFGNLLVEWSEESQEKFRKLIEEKQKLFDNANNSKDDNSPNMTTDLPNLEEKLPNLVEDKKPSKPILKPLDRAGIYSSSNFDKNPKHTAEYFNKVFGEISLLPYFDYEGSPVCEQFQNLKKTFLYGNVDPGLCPSHVGRRKLLVSVQDVCKLNVHEMSSDTPCHAEKPMKEVHTNNVYFKHLRGLLAMCISGNCG